MLDFDKLLRDTGLDRYDRNARIYPALLCLLPVFATVMLWFPPVWTILGGLVTITVAFGAIYFLGQIVRYRGRSIEAQLGTRVGRGKTATLLTFADDSLARASKLRYHAFLRKNGLYIPDETMETADPTAAFDHYRSAVDWLLVHVRPNAKTSGLLNENIAYGFRRNMLGMKPLAILLLLITILANSLLIFSSSEQDRIIAAVVVSMLAILVLLSWIFIIRADFVEDASAAYATRFLEQCEQKGKPRASSKIS